MPVSQTIADEFNRLRGRWAGLAEALGLPESQVRAFIITMKALSYDAQKAITQAIDGDELAVALSEARVARKELNRQKAILTQRLDVGDELPEATSFVAQRLAAVESQIHDLEALRKAQERLSNHAA